MKKSQKIISVVLISFISLLSFILINLISPCGSGWFLFGIIYGSLIKLLSDLLKRIFEKINSKNNQENTQNEEEK